MPPVPDGAVKSLQVRSGWPTDEIEVGFPPRNATMLYWPVDVCQNPERALPSMISAPVPTTVLSMRTYVAPRSRAALAGVAVVDRTARADERKAAPSELQKLLAAPMPFGGDDMMGKAPPER